ncbi:HAMP domain-containing sensor histidine kinase, partial [uncultured Parabacteroides sp.]
KLIFDKEQPSIRLKTDPQRIMQVVSNFVNNAIKFTEKGSITISYKQEGKNLRVSVQDTGIGISEKDRMRIFERFIKINEFKQGTGLGLTISKTIIESLNGTIGVDSVKGSGSTFWFTLPL